MICPNCKAHSISFLPVWLKGSFGSQTCGQCKTQVKLKRTFSVIMSSVLFGLAIGITPFVISYITDEHIFSGRTAATTVIVWLILLALDGIKDYFLIELIAAPAKTTRAAP